MEAAVSLSAAWKARSTASTAERSSIALSPPKARGSEKQVARIAAAFLFMLATYVAVVSALTLLGHHEAKTTYWGIAVLIGAAAIMPWLAKEKQRLSAITGSDWASPLCLTLLTSPFLDGVRLANHPDRIVALGL
ncbi:MAG: hypothetical protein JWQ87_4774 [Candidatus Sulfotelmatobacter sp.]|nr:hypothetical protein [Candidatus Sulfotelmatobacter sp.]